jgi:hypothetical protein
MPPINTNAPLSDGAIVLVLVLWLSTARFPIPAIADSRPFLFELSDLR